MGLIKSGTDKKINKHIIPLGLGSHVKGDTELGISQAMDFRWAQFQQMSAIPSINKRF